MTEVSGLVTDVNGCCGTYIGSGHTATCPRMAAYNLPEKQVERDRWIDAYITHSSSSIRLKHIIQPVLYIDPRVVDSLTQLHSTVFRKVYSNTD